MFTVRLTPKELVALYNLLATNQTPELRILFSVVQAELLRVLTAAQKKN